MQFTAVAIAAILPFLASAAPRAGPVARVENNCAFPIFVQSTPNAGGAPGPVQQLGPKLSGSYSEGFRAGGSAIHAGVTRGLSAPLSLEYTPKTGTVYYDISNEAGNPFPGYRNTLTTSTPRCANFDCAPNDAACYSNGDAIKVQACKEPTNLTLRTCA